MHFELKSFCFWENLKDLAEKLKEVNKEEKALNNETMEIQSTETDAKSRVEIDNKLI